MSREGYRDKLVCQYPCTHRVILMVVPVYIAELAPKKVRGRLVSFTAIGVTTGILVCTCIDRSLANTCVFDFLGG